MLCLLGLCWGGVEWTGEDGGGYLPAGRQGKEMEKKEST